MPKKNYEKPRFSILVIALPQNICLTQGNEPFGNKPGSGWDDDDLDPSQS